LSCFSIWFWNGFHFMSWWLSQIEQEGALDSVCDIVNGYDHLPMQSPFSLVSPIWKLDTTSNMCYEHITLTGKFYYVIEAFNVYICSVKTKKKAPSHIFHTSCQTPLPFTFSNCYTDISLWFPGVEDSTWFVII